MGRETSVKEKVLVFFSYLLGLILIALPVWSMGQINHLTCTRVEPALINCLVEKSWVGLEIKEPITLERLTGAQHRQSEMCQLRGETCKTGVYIEADNETIFWSTRTHDAEYLANNIQFFVENPDEENLDITYPLIGPILIPGVLFIFASLSVLPFVVRIIRLIFRRLTG
ncbi:MAG: hypothetical protein AAF629_04575 [Chloroflexota bacterium]